MTAALTNEATPLITIGVTCYNAEATIGRAIESALAQDWPRLEVIVVDDASSDHSVEIVRALAIRDPRIALYIHDHNRGCASARNQILSKANGEAIAFFDDDDVSRPDRIRLQWQLIQSHQQETGAKLIACYASGRRIYPNDYELPLFAIGSHPNTPQGTVVADYLLCYERPEGVFFGAGTPTCALMAHRTVFQEVGGFDAKLCRQEDVDFAIRLAFLGGHFIGTTEPVLTQFATGGSDKSAAREHESFLALLEKNRSHLERTGRYHYMRSWARLRFHHFNGQRALAILALFRLMARWPLRTATHFARSATNRYLHERRMRA